MPSEPTWRYTANSQEVVRSDGVLIARDVPPEFGSLVAVAPELLAAIQSLSYQITVLLPFLDKRPVDVMKAIDVASAAIAKGSAMTEVTLHNRLYAVVRTESGERLVITRRERRAPNPTGARETEAARVWRVASQRDTLWVLAGLSVAVIH